MHSPSSVVTSSVGQAVSHPSLREAQHAKGCRAR